jgi:hypothetical protein
MANKSRKLHEKSVPVVFISACVNQFLTNLCRIGAIGDARKDILCKPGAIMVHVGVSALLRGISVRALRIKRYRAMRRVRRLVGAWCGKPRVTEPVRTFSVPSGFSATRPPLAIALTAMALIACATAALGTLLAAGWSNEHSLPAPSEMAPHWQQMQTGALPQKPLEVGPPEQPADEASVQPVQPAQDPTPGLAGAPLQAADDPGRMPPSAPVQAAEDPAAGPSTETSAEAGSRSVVAEAPDGNRGSKDPPANRQDGPFAGVWATNEKACSPQLNRDGLLPALISSQGAWAGETTCSFNKSKRVGNTWTFAAVCADSRRRWRADVRMSVVGNRLTWTSQRGSQTYVRCQHGLLEAFERKKRMSPV